VKLDPATGAVIVRTPVGRNPWGVAFDGAAVWIANADSDTLSKR